MRGRAERPTDDVRAALRALAAPVVVGALAVLALNDHVLKNAAPGAVPPVVTGKLSDVAGLVVAPVLLAVLLAAVRLPRAFAVAVLLTGAGFTWVKATAVGATVASTVWSAVAGPSLLLRDPTDLLTLPALGVAWWTLRGERRRPERGRRRAAAVAGALVLPWAVLATAATSPCQVPYEQRREVATLDGRWDDAGPGRSTRLVFTMGYGRAVSLDDAGDVRPLTPSETYRTVGEDPPLTQACDPSRATVCWRIARDPSPPAVEETRDGGATWRTVWRLSTGEADRLRDEAGDECGDARIALDDVAALAGPSGADAPVVVVTPSWDAVLVRGPDGVWRVLTSADLLDLDVGPAPPPSGDLITPATPPPPDPGTVVTPDVPGVPGQSPGSPGVPSPTCASPFLVTVTPDPRNGPPTVQPRCPG